MSAARAPGAARARRRPRRWIARAFTAGVLALAAGCGTASAQSPPGPAGRPPHQVRAGVQPGVAQLGQPVTYQAWVRSERPAKARWLPPDSGAAFTWGTPRVWVTHHVPGSLGRGRGKPRPDATGHYMIDGRDTLRVAIPLQAFALGKLTVPGVQVEIDDGRGPRVYRLPMVTLEIIPVLTAADSNADYRALHGPIAAPWWERVPWTWVVLGLLALVATVLLVRWWRRRRRSVVAPEVPPAALDPRAEALQALAALRALHLPEHGRFAEHAFRLGRILRQFLESTTGITRPGDTTPELVAHLRTAGLDPEDLARFSGLLRIWDRVKFAREPFTLDEAVRSERSIEAFLRRPPAAASERVA